MEKSDIYKRKTLPQVVILNYKPATPTFAGVVEFMNDQRSYCVMTEAQFLSMYEKV